MEKSQLKGEQPKMKVCKKLLLSTMVLALLAVGTVGLYVTNVEQGSKVMLDVSELPTSEEQTEQKTETKKGYVKTKKSVTLRKKASTRGKKVATLKPKETVTIISSTKSWYKVKTSKKKTGYIQKKYITIKKATSSKKSTSSQKGYIKVKSSVTLRKKASTKGARVATLKAGDVVTIKLTSGSWYKVTTSKNKTGYVQKKYVGTKSASKYKLLTTYTTYSKGSPSGRNYNMSKAGKKITKITLKKNQTFNWFKVVGPCGKKQGYKIANIIVSGKVKKGYGGGVCQVATTIHGCSKKLKMKTVERYKHSGRVSYLNKDGYEATVSYGCHNLRFKNTTNKDIVFDVYVSSGRVIVAAYQVK